MCSCKWPGETNEITLLGKEWDRYYKTWAPLLHIISDDEMTKKKEFTFENFVSFKYI